jgi:hypothetical protein
MVSTGFEDLDGLLDALVRGVDDALGPDRVGIYLQGSFALGGADRHSDVDLTMVVARAPTPPQLAALRDLHRRLYGRPESWATHLEGSYVPRAELRRRGPTQRSFWYLDNGSDRLVRDPHCDTQVVRWILREHGIALAGPPAATLIDPVTPAQLRLEARRILEQDVAWAQLPSEVGRMSRWKQPFVVVTLCRILHTLAVGRVVTKRDALAWALETAPTRWHPLLERALADRPDPWARVHQCADDALVEETLAFAGWAAEVGGVAREALG